MNVALLRETLELTLASDDTFPARFYERLFEAHPQLRALFTRNSPGAMNKMFAQKLLALVDHLDDPAWLQRSLGQLVTNHISYGVTDEMYPWVGDALLATLAEACGDRWSLEAETAWRSAYAALVREMIGR